MRLLIFIAVLAAALWSGYWWIGSYMMDRNAETWLEARREEGWVAEAGVNVAGFPNRFDMTLSDVRFADPDKGLAWTAPFFKILMLSYRPNHIIAIWPGTQILSSPGGKLTVAAAEMQGSMVFEADTDLVLKRSNIVIRDMRISSDRGWGASLETGQFATRPTEGMPMSHDIAFRAGRFHLSEPVLEILDPTGRLPGRVETLQLDTVIGFDAPWDRHAIEDRRPQPTFVQLEDMRAVWGDLELRAAGRLTVDRTGLAQGTITLRVKNWREILRLAVNAGSVPRDLAPAIENALGFLAGLSGDPDALDADLTFRHGRVSLGPIPLGPAPVFRLR